MCVIKLAQDFKKGKLIWFLQIKDRYSNLFLPHITPQKNFKIFEKNESLTIFVKLFCTARKTCQNKNGFLLQIQVEDSPPQRGQQGDLVQVGGALQVEEGFERQIRIQLTGR